MENPEPDWKRLLEFFEPKPPLYCPEKMSTTQKAFLRYEGLEALFGGQAGGGKMFSIKTKVPTPSGFVNLEDITPGSDVFGLNGKPCVVLAESDIQVVPGYEFTFDDGTTVASNDEHKWLTYNAQELARLLTSTPEWKERRRKSRPSRAKEGTSPARLKALEIRNAQNAILNTKPDPTGTVRTTAEIVATLETSDGRRNHAIPVCPEVDFPESFQEINPYMLGAWLGDGTSASGGFTGIDPEIWEEFEKLGYRVSHGPNGKSHYISNFVAQLKDIKVFKNKHVPDEYIFSSVEQRVALLQGLLDTDGNIDNGGSVEFSNTNQQIVESLAIIVRSLGMKCRVREYRTKLDCKDCGPGWRVKFKANRQVFRLPRKAERLVIASRQTQQFRYIIKAERTEPLPMKCLKVDSLDELFLITENFIPTHNSSALLMAALQYTDVPGYAAMLFRRTFADLILPGALMDRFKTWMSAYDDIKWDGSTYTATFPSSARVSFGYLNNELDHLRYKGVELQFIGMDEVSEIRESHYKYLFSRLRRPPSGPLSQVPLRMRSASNPAPNWVRQHFIVEGEEKGRIFVPSSMDDNPGVDVESYRAALSKLDPVERKRLEEGDWWATALGSMFQRGNFQIIDPTEIPELSGEARMVRFWDMAATEVSSSNLNPDWTVGTLMLFDQGRAYVLDVQRERKAPAGVEKLLAQVAEEDGPSVPIRMEQEPGSAGKIASDQYSRYVLPGYDFSSIPSMGDKQLRARPFASAVANKNVFVVRSRWLTDWFDEFTSFPESCDHDDQVDSAVGAFNFLTGLGGKMKRKPKILI